MATVLYKFTLTQDCHGNPVDPPTIEDNERNFTVWAGDPASALSIAQQQFALHVKDDVNPSIDGSDRYHVRPMTDEEIAAMKALFNT
jgi:hypothetical protein